ncbi:MAG TPA: MMPL family transporter [Candidatus Luteococcus avicola]|nr:MMPL family transporter [Candidatus Luteococcus avicola]
MSGFLYEVGQWCYRFHRRVLALWLAALVLLGALAVTMGGTWKDQFSIPGAASQEALTKLRMTFPQVAALGATALVELPEGSKITDPEVKAAITSGIDKLKATGFVQGATEPWSEYVHGLVSDDGRAGVVQLQLEGTMDTFKDDQRETLVKVSDEITAELPAGSTVSMGGEAYSVSVPTLSVTEAAGVVVALVVLALTLGSLVAAGLPILTALVGVGLTVCIMMVFARFTPVMSTTPMLAVMLGLAVGIDYALFILSRHREQLSHGLDVEESAARAVATAGSAVVFAGLTVMIALVGLGLGGVPFLTAMGLFASLGIAFAVVIALTLLPAMMGFLGERMRPKHAVAEGEARPNTAQTRFFRGWVRAVTKFPWLTILVVLVGVAALSWPARNLTMALPNAGQSALGSPARTSYDAMAKHFGAGSNGPLIVTADLLTSTDPMGVMNGLKADIEKLPGVASVPAALPNQNADTGFVQVIPTTAPDDPATKDVVNALIAQHQHWLDAYGVDTGVTGSTAIQIDITSQLTKALLPFGIFVVGLSLVLLTMVFRSIYVPLKATIGYLFSIGVAFGLTTLVFNEGWGKELVNLERPMPVISFLPILLMGILFGLAMDYEVFLVSRIREEYVHGRSAREAIEEGFIGAGPVVAAAAVIMFVVFAFFVPEGEGPIKTIAFSLAVGVAVDAFVVRMTLVPAVLQLLGDRAWWLPGWLDRLLPSLDVEGEGLAHQLALADWPSTGHVEPVHAEALAVDGLVGPVDLSLQPSQVAAVVGDVRTRSAALLALSGRLKTTAGRARVAGSLLPDQSVKVRRDTDHLDLATSTDPAGDLARLVGRPAAVAFVDGIESGMDERAVTELVRLVETRRQQGRAVVLGVADAEAAAALTPDVTWQPTATGTPVIRTAAAREGALA